MKPFTCLLCEASLSEKKPFSVPVSDTVSANPLCRPCAAKLSVDEILSFVATQTESWPPEAPRKEKDPPGRMETARLSLERWFSAHGLDEDPLDVRDIEKHKGKAAP